MKTIIRVLFFVVVITLIIFGIAAYLFLVPKSLGVTTSPEDLASLRTKTNGGITFETLPASDSPAKSITFSGSKSVDAQFTSSELTAFFAASKWKYNVFKNTQVRVNADGTVELAGALPLDRLANFAVARGISITGLTEYTGALSSLGIGPAFHIKLNGSGDQNKLSLSVSEASIGPITIPGVVLQKNQAALQNTVQTAVTAIPGVHIDHLDFKNGTMNFKGTIPEKVSRVTE